MDFLKELRETGKHTYIAFDGALSENISAFLSTRSLTGRPLFKASVGADVVLAGPWLTSVAPDKKTAERQIAGIEELGGGVCWLADCNEDAMYAHLRQLNAAQMPDGRIVFFRHYDVDVLAAIVPLVDEKQAAKLFGPACAIALIGGPADKKFVRKPEDLAVGGSGPIAFNCSQIEILDERQRNFWRTACVSSVRGIIPSKTSGLSDEELRELIIQHEKTGQSIGLSSENALVRWVCLEILTNGGGSRSQWLREHVRRLGPTQRNFAFESDFDSVVDRLVADAH